MPVILLHCPDVQGKGAFWVEVEDKYLPLIDGHYHADLAYAFLSWVRRQVHADMWRASTYSSARARDEETAPRTSSAGFCVTAWNLFRLALRC